MKQNNVAVILVNYFNEAEVISYVQSELLPQSDKRFHIYIVNNGSEGSSLKDFCASEPRTTLVDAAMNLGYLGGFVYAVEQLSGQWPDLLILSNADIALPDRDMLSKILHREWSADEAMAGPSILSTRTGHNQNPFYRNRLTNRKLRFLSFVFSFYPVYLFYAALGYLKAMLKRSSGAARKDSDQSVYAIHGSFMIFTRPFIERNLPEIKEGPFLFGEEIHFAEIAARSGMKTIFIPRLILKHNEHSTTGLFKSPRMLKFMKASVRFPLTKRMQQHGIQG